MNETTKVNRVWNCTKLLMLFLILTNITVLLLLSHTIAITRELKVEQAHSVQLDAHVKQLREHLQTARRTHESRLDQLEAFEGSVLRMFPTKNFQPMNMEGK